MNIVFYIVKQEVVESESLRQLCLAQFARYVHFVTFPQLQHEYLLTQFDLLKEEFGHDWLSAGFQAQDKLKFRVLKLPGSDVGLTFDVRELILKGYAFVFFENVSRDFALY